MLEFVQTKSGPQEYKLGQEVEHNGMAALVVRIVDHCCLFEIPLKRYVVDELYVELLTQQGETVFITLKRETRDVERPEGQTLRGPEPLMKLMEDSV